MTDVEELLRRTFTERERDLAGAAPSLAGVRERSRHRRRQQAAGLAGAAAVAAVLVGSTVALTGGPQQAATAPSASPAPTGATTPAAPAGRLPGFREEPLTSAGGRTSAVIRWAPTWLPDGIGETGRVVSTSQQIRFYGRTVQGPMVRVMSIVEGCGTPEGLDGGTPPRSPVVAGIPAMLWAFQRPPHLGPHFFQAAPAAAGHLVCVPVAGGGFWIAVTGSADTAGDALRVAGSIRPAGPAEVAVRISVAMSTSWVSVRADHGATGRLPAALGTGNADAELEPPDPDGPPPNTTVDGRPAHLTSSAAGGAVLTVPLGSDLEAVFTAHFPDNTPAQNRDSVLTSARGLQLGATPDYSWLSR